MNKKRNFLIPAFSMVLCNFLLANDFTVENSSLKEAIKKISKEANMTYMVDFRLLENKTAPNIKNIEGVQNALDKILKNTNLEAIIKDKTILVRKKTKIINKSNKKDKNEDLGVVQIKGAWLGDSKQEDIKTYSGARTIIEAKTLSNLAAKNIEAVLRVVSGIQIQDETGTGVLPNISLRGLKPGRSANLNAMVNGVPAAIAPYSHSSFSLFPITMETLQSIDIVRGGAAIHYGPNNVGGVVNFITKPISIKPSFTIKETLHSSNNGNILSDTYLKAGGFINDKLGLQLQYNNINGESFRKHSYTNINNFIFDLEYLLSDNSEIKSNFQYYKANADLPGALLPNQYEEDRSISQRPYDEFYGKTKRASIKYKLNPNYNSEFYWMNYAQNSKRKFDWGWNTTGLGFTPNKEDSVRVANRKITVFGSEPRFTYEKENHKIMFGARYVREDVDYLLYQTKFNDNIRKSLRDWKIKTNALAFYLSDTLTLINGKLKITPGLRYEKIDTDFGDNKSQNKLSNKQKNMKSWLPGLTLGYQATDELFLFTNAQRSLKPPQVAQVRKDGDLAAELAWNYEIGFRYEINSKINLDSTLYRIDYEDQIEYVSSTQAFQNLGKTKHQGVETQVTFKPTQDIQFVLGYTYLDTEQLSGKNKGKKLPWVAKHQVSLSSDYKFANNTLNLTGVYLSKAFSDSSNIKEESKNGQFGEVPSYMLWSTKISTQVKLNDKLNANLSFGINNIFNENYYFRGVDVSPVGRVPGQGRSFVLSAKIDF